MANQLMKIGGIGSIIWLIAMIVSLIVGFALASEMMGAVSGGITDVESLMAQLPGWYIPAALVATILSVVGVVLTGIGAYGLFQQFKNSLAQVAAIIGVIGGVLSIIPIVNIVSIILVGVFLILLGVVLLNLKDRIKLGYVTATAVLCIITGALHASIIGALFAYLLGIPTLILLAMLYFKA